MEFLLFFFYSILIFSVILMLLSINPINSVLFLISTFFSGSFIFILMNIDFLGLLFLMVYVGAIAVLFLFIVMMLNIKKIESDNTTYLLLGISILFLLSIQLFYIFLYKNNDYINKNIFLESKLFFFNEINYTDLESKDYLIKRLGLLIFLKNPFYVFFSGILLLIAMLGSIYLTNLKKGYSMRSQYNQLTRNNFLYNVYLY